ncbi:hypothetical protein GLOTRDRAFT_125020 [Gloeophyllum trabeum ATCC 11539]|uniref:DUF6589 domain-containing protein n=1 Tax=Gloeophyllum trabeum (strain ATCC 11539 / FP-39264 / Madison 617) TaxID=670483 RepID=S7QP45_GLOTA|nr:uncharacterized protein GLOTRDRAFT_125020 [Gloeophyllum trabeum ATCC 11539]EPQ61298.1 hypothetical protein GLOTRDRAFT_125020 [Gloeophyllum trabeum ATCC 11539]
MPKYADALFHIITHLKQMDPKLRHTFLMNWLVNLSGMPDSFKEVDLLQEHQNVWAKYYIKPGQHSLPAMSRAELEWPAPASQQEDRDLG